MDWVAEIKKVRNEQLRVFSKTGLVAENVARQSKYVGARSEIYIVQDDGIEFSIDAFAGNVGRPGHKVTVFFLSAEGWQEGWSIAYFNHNMNSLVFDKQLSGSSDGKFDPKLEGPPFAAGCFGLLAGGVVAFLLAAVAGGTVILASFLSVTLAVFFLLNKYAFKDGQRRVEWIYRLIAEELARVKAAGSNA